MKQTAVCHTCRHRHGIEFDPRAGAGAQYSDWLAKHAGHAIQFLSPRRRQRDAVRPGATWESYLSNADVRVAYAASASVTVTLASLAASSSLLAGRETGALDFTTTKYLDCLVSGHFRTGSSNLQAGVIRLCVIGQEDDTPTWPDVFDGTDSVETVSAQGIYDSICLPVKEITTDTTQRTWPVPPVAIAGFFGNILPGRVVLFVSHSAHTSTNAWSGTEGDHALKYQPVYATITG